MQTARARKVRDGQRRQALALEFNEQVYCARDTRLDRLVAVKVLPAGAGSAQALERFEREARAIAALSHPRICSVYDVGTSPVPFLVMELRAELTRLKRESI